MNIRDLFIAQLKDQSFVKRQLLRQIAVEQLKNESQEEIGSSDVSNVLFSLWKDYKNFDSILENYV